MVSEVLTTSPDLGSVEFVYGGWMTAVGRRTDMERVIGYIRVSTAEQAGSGLGLDAQRAQIASESERKGWTVVEVYVDAGGSGKSLSGRPGLAAALGAVESGTAEGLVVAKLDRLSRSMIDFAGLVVRAKKRKWNIVALDLGLDLSTPNGKFMANVMASVAEWERETIAQRTREALAVARQRGVRLGRPRAVTGDVYALIEDMRRGGQSLAKIASRLNDLAVPTGQGGTRWYPSTVRGLLLSRGPGHATAEG